MEKPSQLFDICIVCALPEEARAFLEVVQPQCEDTFEEHVSPSYHYSYRFATIKNDKEEPLNLHVSWLPRYGPHEMTLHLSRVLEECQPRIAIMTGMCACDAHHVQLGDPGNLTLVYDAASGHPASYLDVPGTFWIISSTVNFNNNNDNAASPNTGTGLPRQLQFMVRVKF